MSGPTSNAMFVSYKMPGFTGWDLSSQTFSKVIYERRNLNDGRGLSNDGPYSGSYPMVYPLQWLTQAVYPRGITRAASRALSETALETPADKTSGFVRPTGDRPSPKESTLAHFWNLAHVVRTALQGHTTSESLCRTIPSWATRRPR